MRVRGILRVTRVTVRADENALLYGNADVVQNPDEVVNRRCLEGCGFVLTSERDLNFVARDPGRDQNVNFSLPLRFASQNGQLPSFLHANAWHLVHHRNQVFEDVSLDLVGHRLATHPIIFLFASASVRRVAGFALLSRCRRRWTGSSG